MYTGNRKYSYINNSTRHLTLQHLLNWESSAICFHNKDKLFLLIAKLKTKCYYASNIEVNYLLVMKISFIHN